MVASLRKLKEEALDDELEAMREMEMESEEAMFAASRKSRPTATNGAAAAQSEAAARSGKQSEAVAIQEGTLQHKQSLEKPVLLGGFDDENLYDSQEEEQLDRGQPLRVFKKKGQKRTTRRVNIRPTRAKRPSVNTNDDNDDDSENGGKADDDQVVPETQFDATKLGGGVGGDSDPLSGGSSGSESDDGGSDFEHADSNDDYDGDETKKTSKRKATKLTKQQPKQTTAKDKEKEEGIVKKGIRKVKATAHANFKRLKLKNSGARGGPGYNSRFRRRR